MWHRIARTSDDNTLLFMRTILGIVILPHGAQKLLGWFGGPGLAATLDFFRDSMGIPLPLALLIVIVESLGALALIAGIGSRLAAAGIGAVMIGAVVLVHLPYGFFMNWLGQQAGEGFEYHLLALALALVIVVKGGGALSLDRKLASA